MKLLFAAPDRDLLDCFKRLLEPDFSETVTAFDGTQVISLLSAEKFDLVILDRELPRVGREKIFTQIRELNVPVIELICSPAGMRRLTDACLPDRYLSYPFSAEQLKEAVRDVIKKASSDERFGVGGLVIDVGRFRIENGPRLTSGEIDVLKTLSEGVTVPADAGAYIGALNAKFARTGSNLRIKYRTGKGFEAVTQDE
ncbi:MAG: response regulator transcription factor [Clostridia bacterium]|nr:response regulator transcription factor [Clostridia bacterium]